MKDQDPQKDVIGEKALDEEAAERIGQFGLAVPIWDRPVTPEEIQYFLDRWPYLQILSSNTVEALEAPQLVVASHSNWTIVNYGDAMSSSPGAFLFGGTGADGDGINPGKGTVRNQAYMTVGDMVHLAQSLGWEGIHIVDGHPLMKWALWMHALDEKIAVMGFHPSEKDQERRERVKRSQIDEEKLLIRRRLER